MAMALFKNFLDSLKLTEEDDEELDDEYDEYLVQQQEKNAESRNKSSRSRSRRMPSGVPGRMTLIRAATMLFLLRMKEPLSRRDPLSMRGRNLQEPM